MTEIDTAAAPMDAENPSAPSSDSRYPLVSVVIPAYQAEDYLRSVLDSVLAQDYPNLEVVVIDNNSSDGTRDILDAETDERLRVVRNTSTLPVLDNWNFAIGSARGDFVKLVCVDDRITPDCVSQQAAILARDPGVAVVSVKTNYIDDDDEVIMRSRGLTNIAGRVPAQLVIRQIVRSGANPIGGPVSVMFRRSAFEQSGGFSSEFMFLADLHLWVRLLRCGDFHGLPGTHASFRVRSGSLHGLTSARVQLSQTIEFDRALADDPHWRVSAADRVRGLVRCYEQQVRRTVLFGLTNWRVKGRDRRTPWLPSEPEVGAPVATTSLSTVICAYTTQRWSDLCRAVDSVLAQDVADSDVVVVIDHCPELLGWARDRFGHDDRVTVVESRESRGLSGARNAGVAVATGDVVAFLDDDAAAEPGWATALLRHYRDDRVAGVGGYAAPEWHDDRPAWMPAEFDWVVGCSYTGQPTELLPVRNPLGCNMSLRRSVLNEVGGFRSEVGRVGTHPVGGEETELCIRIAADDPSSVILFDPDARVRHHVTADRATLRYFRRRCYHEGMSKAVVTELAEASNALSTERAYTRSVLPRGIAREALSMRGDGLTRAGVMVLGLAVTTSGYANAKIRRRLAVRRSG